ncbi:MAG: hypothetical protein R3211_11125 [Balneolaceae bacterium]|nr:hypothetical protein [Balneolaceae bacterium]
MNEEILQNINRRLDEALERGRRIVEDEDLVRQLEDLKQRTEKLIREHPLKSIAAGLLAGYLLGRILSSDD